MRRLSERVVHARALRILNRAGIPYSVAGAVALGHYTGIWRETKDLDLFLTPDAVDDALRELAVHGFQTQLLAPHWLAKAVWHDWVVDLIFGFGGWRAQIDDTLLARSQDMKVYGVSAKVMPPEELIWVKTYVAHRERYDGADIAHVLRSTADRLDWPHLLWRFGPDWELLLAHLVMFGMIYPSERGRIPAAVWDELVSRLATDLHEPEGTDPVCRGTCIDRFSYLPDVEAWGYWDARTRWAVQRGFHPSVIVADRSDAHQLLASGEVRPAEIA